MGNNKFIIPEELSEKGLFYNICSRFGKAYYEGEVLICKVNRNNIFDELIETILNFKGNYGVELDRPNNEIKVIKTGNNISIQRKIKPSENILKTFGTICESNGGEYYIENDRVVCENPSIDTIYDILESVKVIRQPIDVDIKLG